MTRLPDDLLDDEAPPRRRGSDKVMRYAQAGGVGLSTALLMFVLSSVNGLREEAVVLGHHLTTLQAGLERVQASQEVARSQLGSYQAAVDARLNAWEAGRTELRSEMQRTKEDVRDLVERVIRVERQCAQRIGASPAPSSHRLAQLLAAIDELGSVGPAGWTQESDARPTVQALRALTGAAVSASERDQAWAAWQLSRQLPELSDPSPATEPEVVGQP
jgi:hypothetical protein